MTDKDLERVLRILWKHYEEHPDWYSWDFPTCGTSILSEEAENEKAEGRA